MRETAQEAVMEWKTKFKEACDINENDLGVLWPSVHALALADGILRSNRGCKKLQYYFDGKDRVIMTQYFLPEATNPIVVSTDLDLGAIRTFCDNLAKANAVN